MDWQKADPINYQGGRGRSEIEGRFGRVVIEDIPSNIGVNGVEIKRNQDVGIDKENYVVWQYKEQAPVVIAEDGFYYDKDNYSGPDPNQQAFLVLRILSGEGLVTSWREKQR